MCGESASLERTRLQAHEKVAEFGSARIESVHRAPVTRVGDVSCGGSVGMDPESLSKGLSKRSPPRSPPRASVVTRKPVVSATPAKHEPRQANAQIAKAMLVAVVGLLVALYAGFLFSQSIGVIEVRAHMSCREGCSGVPCRLGRSVALRLEC